MSRGRFIVFDGPDGAGKTTQLARLARYLRDRGHAVLETREPGGSPLAEAVRGLLLDDSHADMPAESELLLMYAARHAHLQQTVLPALAEGTQVLCDRYVDASHAYQGAGRGLRPELLSTLDQTLPVEARPDRTLIFDLPDAVAEQRLAVRGAGDRFDAEPEGFRAAVREAFRQRAAAQPDSHRLIAAGDDIETVERAVHVALEGLW